MKEKIKNEVKDFKLLMRNVPTFAIVLLCLAVVLMNLLANKEIDLGFLVTDCGILASWLVFLIMDMLATRFGPKVTVKLSMLGLVVNLGVCALFFIVSKIPSNWAMFYDFEDPLVNIALDGTLGGTWYVLLGSSIAYIVSAIVNAWLNWLVGVACKKQNFLTYALRSYVSTALAQFADNFTFALIVSHVFFGWTLGQCVIAAITTMVVELIAEVIFSPFGYRISKSWRENNVGQEYIDAHK